MALYPRIADASLDNPESFAERVLDILRDEFPIKAASLFSYQPSSQLLVLRGQSGLDYSAYKSFELSIDTPAGQPITTGNIYTTSDISLSVGYRDKELINRYNLKSMVAVLLQSRPSSSETSQNPLGVICAYPFEAESLGEISMRLREIAPFIAKLYSAALDQIKMRLRKTLVEKAGYSHDMSGLMHRIVRTFRDCLQVETASIFLHDQRNSFLRLRASTASRTVDHKNVFYVKDSQDPTNVSFRKNQMLVFQNTKPPFDSKKTFEIVQERIRNGILVPIDEPAVHPKDVGEQPPVIGVLRVFNHTLTHQRVSHLTAFGWEEVTLIAFFVEMIAVMAHFMTKGDNAQNDFARSMHGASNNLQSAQFNLMLLEDDPTMLSVTEKANLLSNAIAFLGDIRSQVSRLEFRHNEKLETEETSIFGDVLSKLPQTIHRLAQAYDVGSFEVTQLKDKGFDKLPKVAGNKEALLCVFRNLAENAVKYCRPDSRRHKIDISYKVLDDTLKICFADNGVGIPSEYAHLIFVEGYRTDDAIARHPSSNGWGLADSRELMEKMNGSIVLAPDSESTVFEVTIRRWK
jgi:two-component sensor histidine kinase